MGQPSIKVSVVVPTFNRGSILHENADSILAQDFDDYEVVYVDDGSTDDTADVLARYASSHPERVTLVRTANGGPGAARNAGVRVARGEFLLFTDDDATAPRHWVRGMLERHEAQGCEVLSGGISPHSMTTRAERYLHHRMQTSLGTTARRVTAAPTGNLMLSRELFLAVGGFLEARLPAAEDWELCHRLTAHGASIMYDPAVRVVHRYETEEAAALEQIRATGAAGVALCGSRYRSVTAYVAYSLLRFLLSPLWVPRHYPLDLYFLALRMEAAFCGARLRAYRSRSSKSS